MCAASSGLMIAGSSARSCMFSRAATAGAIDRAHGRARRGAEEDRGHPAAARHHLAAGRGKERSRAVLLYYQRVPGFGTLWCACNTLNRGPVVEKTRAVGATSMKIAAAFFALSLMVGPAAFAADMALKAPPPAPPSW